MSRVTSSPAIWVLAALADRPRDAAGLVKQVGALTQGELRMSTEALRAVLTRLVRENMVDTDTTDGPEGTRHWFALTAGGVRALIQDAQRPAPQWSSHPEPIGAQHGTAHRSH